MATLTEALTLAVAHHQAGRLELAAEIYRRILAVEPEHADAMHLLGVLLHHRGQHAEAAGWIERAIERRPLDAAFHNNLGEACRALNETGRAVACYRRALELRPEYAKAYNNLGIALASQGQLAEAADCYRRALVCEPQYALAYNNLGNVLKQQGLLADAAECFQQAIALQPQLAEAHLNLGGVLKDQGHLAQAIGSYQRAGELNPRFATVHANPTEAANRQPPSSTANRGMQNASPPGGYAEAHSNLLYTLYFSPHVTPQTLYEEHRRWHERFAAPLAQGLPPHTNDRSPERRLRVGYVSPDMRGHPVGLFLRPLFAAHDHRQFEIYAYASVRHPDAMTAGLRASVDTWRDVCQQSDAEVADLVRRDAIDILVDLTMHMADHRLLAFARRPAPVQVTYLAYCSTTGLDAIDYRLTDPYLDPPDRETPFYSERSVWLPETYWCYQPAVETPAVNVAPAAASGHVTFGCLNNFCKVSAPALSAWCELLRTVPNARLLLHAYAGSHREGVLAFLAQQGIASERLEFIDFLPTTDYFGVYHRIDVALDPFPYGGGTTTCDALWMGVPVVSLAGATAVGRGGVSILSNVGLPELVAQTPAQLVRIAADLAQDFPRLAQLRATLRARMQRSPLMDAPRFARHVEAAYRAMWRRWCVK
jgi:predicted O-linked N-acetylglucosamine transferase (SPINDLY family)